MVCTQALSLFHNGKTVAIPASESTSVEEWDQLQTTLGSTADHRGVGGITIPSQQRVGRHNDLTIPSQQRVGRYNDLTIPS